MEKQWDHQTKKQVHFGVVLLLAGLLFVGIKLEVDTNISYGFSFGVNEGVQKGGMTYLTEKIIGDSLRIDLFFNPLGYALILLGALQLGRESGKGFGKMMNNIKAAAVFGAAVHIICLFLPFLLSQYKLLMPLLACIGLELCAQLVIMYSLMIACKKQIDNYKYMEVGKDLSFAVEIYGFAVVFSYVTMPFAALYLYFARAAYAVLLLISYAAIIYYIWKVWFYTKKLGLFCPQEQSRSGFSLSNKETFK